MTSSAAGKNSEKKSTDQKKNQEKQENYNKQAANDLQFSSSNTAKLGQQKTSNGKKSLLIV